MAREPRHLHRLLALFDRRTLAASSIVAEMISGSFGYKNNPSQKVTPSKFWSHAPLAYSQNVGGRFMASNFAICARSAIFLSKIEKGARRVPCPPRGTFINLGCRALVAGGNFMLATAKSLYSQNFTRTTDLDAS